MTVYDKKKLYLMIQVPQKTEFNNTLFIYYECQLPFSLPFIKMHRSPFTLLQGKSYTKEHK